MTTRVSILDLPITTISEIEVAVGAPMTEWPSGVKSMADLYSRIYAAGTGQDLAKVQAMSLRQLMDLVDVSGEEQEEDPT